MVQRFTMVRYDGSGLVDADFVNMLKRQLPPDCLVFDTRVRSLHLNIWGPAQRRSRNIKELR